MLIGIETGGTKIVCSAGTSPQDVVDVATVPTQDPTSTLQSVTAFVTRWQQEAGLEGAAFIVADAVIRLVLLLGMLLVLSLFRPFRKILNLLGRKPTVAQPDWFLWR